MESNSSVITKENHYSVSLNDNYEDQYVSLLNTNKKNKKQLPFIVYIFLFTLILFIGAIISLLIISSKYNPNYTNYAQDIFLKQNISNHNYSKLVFNNKLEIVLIQVHFNDSSGGAISFEKGYLDLEYDPGYLKLVFNSLRNSDMNSIRYLNYYMGDLQKSTEEFYSTIYFKILNSGFQKYLNNFTNNINFNIEKDNITALINNGSRRMQNSPPLDNLEEKEKHLLEFLVYNIKDKNGKDIWRQCIEGMKEIKYENLKNQTQIKEIMKDLFNPSKVRMVFYSHYKMSLMRKIVLKGVNNLTNLLDTNIKEKKVEKYYDKLTTNKIIYHQIQKNESHYIKINFYVKGNNSNLSELYKDSGYFNYIKYILDETHNESLYYELTHHKKLNIKSLSCNFEVILKSKIRFSLLIKLNENSYQYLNEIIEIVYNYIEKIKAHINNLDINDERVEELYRINEQNFTFTEDNHEEEYFKNKAKDLFYKDDKNLFLKEVWIPSDLNKSNTKIKFYSEQLTIKNSVIFVSISDYIVDKYNLSNSSYSFIFSDLKQTTKSSNITYSIHDIDKLNINITTINAKYKLKYYQNKFISKYNNTEEILKADENITGIYTPLNSSDNLAKFYWLKSTKFNIPKVYVNLYFFHPYLRPNDENENEKDKIFFYLMLYIAYLRREINFLLGDAIRAGNMIKLDFIENFFYIDIFAYSDKIKDIMEIINKEIISKKENIIYDNLNIYKDYALNDLLNFDRVDIKEVMKYEYYKGLTKNDIIDKIPPIYNFYKFNKSNFYNFTINETENYLSWINAPIVHGFILGYCEREDAEDIYNIFKNNYTETYFHSQLLFLYKNYKINYKIKPKRFVAKILNRNKLSKNESFDDTKELTGEIYTFMNFAKYSYENRIVAELFKKILNHNNERKYTVDIINQKYISLRYYISKVDYSYSEQFLNTTINKIENNRDYYTKEQFDVVGNYFYYIVTNLEIEFSKTPNNMKDSAIAYSYNELYELQNVSSYKIDRNNYDSFIDAIKQIMKDNTMHYDFSNKYY